MENLVTFWKKKRVFITGHTGFKGSWLALWLSKLEADVIGFSLPPPTTPNLFTLAKVAKDITHINGDIRHFPVLQQTIKRYQPDIIIHMAAQPLVRQSYQHPVETYSTNVLGTLHLLEAAKQIKNTYAIVNVTTDKCYENKNRTYSENDMLGGHDPYSSSKACSELLTASYRNSYSQNVASARAGNVIGGGDWAKDRLIPDIISGCLNKKNITLRHPNALRPWQHVLEPLSGYLLLAQRLYENPMQFADAWNFGPDEEVKSVQWITEYILNQWQNPISWTKDSAEPLHETHYLQLNCEKAKKNLQWQSRWNLTKALDETINWYQAYQENKNMREFSLRQIELYAK